MRIPGFLRAIFHRRAAAPSRQDPPGPGTAPSTPAPSGPAAEAYRGRSGFDPTKLKNPTEITVHQAEGFSAPEREKLRQAADLLATVVNSQEFKDAVLSGRFVDDGGKTPAEIYGAIREASETLAPGADREIDLNLETRQLSWFHRNVVGYSYPNTETITVNRRWLTQMSPAELAGHLAHEWLHKLGFEHDFGRTAERADSVPYKLGDCVEELASRAASLRPADELAA